MVVELAAAPRVRWLVPTTIESLPVAEVAVIDTVPVGTVQPVPEHLTVAVKVIGAPCTTGNVCPAASFRVMVEERAADADCQLFTRALASNEPRPRPDHSQFQ